MDRICASSPCIKSFEPRTKKQIYCSALCNSREQERRYRRKRPALYLEKKRRWCQKNKSKINENRKRRYASDPDFRKQCRQNCKESSLRRMYGLTQQERENLLIKQNYRCANQGCQTTEPGSQGWHIDHDHTSGKVRGLLCRSCNLALGLVHDNPKRLCGLSEYIRGQPCGHMNRQREEL